MSGVTGDLKADSMDVNEEADSVRNGLSEPMDVDEGKDEKSESEANTPAKITSKSRKSSSSVSSERSTNKESSKPSDMTKKPSSDSSDEKSKKKMPSPVSGVMIKKSESSSDSDDKHKKLESSSDSEDKHKKLQSSFMSDDKRKKLESSSDSDGKNKRSESSTDTVDKNKKSSSDIDEQNKKIVTSDDKPKELPFAGDDRSNKSSSDSESQNRMSSSSDSDDIPKKPSSNDGRKTKQPPSTSDDTANQSFSESSKKNKKAPLDSDDEDFLGFPSPVDTSARDRFLQLIGKRVESEPVDDDTRSFSDKMSVDNVDSDSAAENLPPPKPSKSAVSKRSVLVDISGPIFKKPFEHGWVREIVFRAPAITAERAVKRNADVYYYTPTGKKVRSSREVADYLSGDLTVENFTFLKEPIGVNDSTKEIVREARVLNSEEMSSTVLQQKKSAPPIKPKSKSLVDSQGRSTPKVAFKFANKKPSSAKKPDKTRKSISGPDQEDDTSDDTDWDMVQKNPTREVCSIECRLAMGLIPTLKCDSCLCLYHPECVGLQQDKLSSSKAFLCKNCQGLSGQQQSQPPKSNNNVPPLPPPPPLLPMTPQTASNHPRKPASKPDTKVSSNRQNIVGTVTTWLPSSSSIQVSQSSPTPKTTTTSTTMTTAPTSSTKPSAPEIPHQGLLEIGSNAFVVVPRHNVVNVSNQTSAAPAVGVTANSLNPSQTQSNGILLVPLSVQPPDSTLADVSTSVQNSVTKTVAAGSTANAETNGLKRASDSSLDEDSPLPKIKVKLKEIPPMYMPNNFFTLSDAATMSMSHFFQYLKVHELLRATQVNKTWHFIATHQSLWETVRMKNSKVRDFEGFANALRKYNTRSLDLRKMITPESPEDTNEMWSKLASVIGTLPNLRKLDFGRCSPNAIEVITASGSHLESITSLSIRGDQLNMSSLGDCRNLTELRLKSFGGIEIKNVMPLMHLKNLTTLVLTTIKNLDGIDAALPENLESLELGECVKLTEKFATVALPKMVRLKRLRLERGQGPHCPTLPILLTVSTLPNLVQLELINFDIKPGFDKALSKCSNIKVLLIIPTYVTQSATTNHVVMGGVSKLSGSLQYFIWGLTMELLRVTDLFIEQVEGNKSKTGGAASSKKAGIGDSIPILKPFSEESPEAKPDGSTSQVDILGLPKLQRVLSTLLPQTKIKILKIPFSATWRQTVTDIPV